MNERIRQLAEQAYEYSDISNSGELFEEKFAELIVAECARIVTDYVDHCEPASTYADKVKQHFGVE
jgi:hypothetical protein